MAGAQVYAVRHGLVQVGGWDPGDKDSTVALSGAFKQTATADGTSTDQGASSIIGRTTGKWYGEFVCGASWSGGDTGLGLGKSGASHPNFGASGALGLILFPSQALWHGTSYGASGIAPTNNSVVGVAVDLDNNLGWMTLTGSSWTFSGDPAAGTNGKAGGWSVGDIVKLACVINLANANLTVRCRRKDFTLTIPSGFRPWQGD